MNNGSFLARAMRMLALTAAVAAATLPARAEVMRQGFFEGADLRPLGSDEVRLPEQAPAIVFIFTPEGPALDALSKFDSWAASTGGGPARFAVAVSSGEASRVAIEEVLFQRNIKVPVYLTRTDFLAGKTQRVLHLVAGESRDLADVEHTTLSAAAGTAPVAPAATPTPPVASSEPTPMVIPTPTPIVPVPPPDFLTTAVLTQATDPLTTSPDDLTTPPLRGAAYANDVHKFRIVFPEGWDYEEAANQAGAKGLPPDPGMTTDLRAYAVPMSQGRTPEGNAAQAYFDAFRERMGNRGLADIEVTGRYEIADREFKGREFEYSFTQPGRGEFRMDSTRAGRGRIQVFTTGGVYKVALAEGPEFEYRQHETAINAFMESFHPY